MKSNGNRLRVSNDREVLTPARVEASPLFGNEVNIPSSGSRDRGLVHNSGVKGRTVVLDSENARKAFDEMPKLVSGEDKVTPGDPKGSEDGSEEDDGEDEESDGEQTEDEDDFEDEESVENRTWEGVKTFGNEKKVLLLDVDKATALLQKNLEIARASLEVLVADLQFLRDQLEIM
ncbi:hypothetical protein U1Q18_032599 [Sarracenia purpurea var. burkii]